ncbi:MAG: DEAD/DEAH box helicase family protein [Pirellulales bacterium]|nr:DEAD/DEAH box helicase family protein [Pirellulales bacterium]
MELRKYQQDAVNAVYRHLRERNDNPCIVCPTGAGKTLLITTICRDAITKWNGRVLVLAHVKELLEQTAGTLRRMAPDLNVGVYSAGLKRRDTDHPVIVAGIQSVYRRACELDRCCRRGSSFAARRRGHLIETARWWKDYNPAPVNPATGLKPNLDDEHPTPAVVPYTDEGFAVLDELGTQADDEYDAATAEGDRVRAVLWTRVCENATRLALVYACSRDHEAPTIDREAAEWASRFVRHLAGRMLFLASSHVADNPFHAECLKVKGRLRDAPGQCLQRQQLLRALRCKAADFDQIIDTLKQQGEIVSVDIPTKTKTAQGYRLT